MPSITTPADICSHCGTSWKAGWTYCHGCGARASMREHVLSEAPSSWPSSGLELDAAALAHARARHAEDTQPFPVPESEAPTRELAPELGPQTVLAARRVRATQFLSGGLALLLIAQLLWPQQFSGLTSLALASLNGAPTRGWQWLLAGAPWALTGLVLALALVASEMALGRALVRSVVIAALGAVAPVVLLWGWETLHGHLGAALMRQGARGRASLLLGWSRAVLIFLGIEVLLQVVAGLGLAHLPVGVLAGAGALVLAARLGHLCALTTTLPAVLNRPSAAATPLPSRLRCPDCGEEAPPLLRFREGLVGNTCTRCSGALLGPGQVTSLLAMARVEGATYEREVRLGGPGMRLMGCPKCGSAMREVQLRAVTAHGCPGCGSLWLARGGLPRLTGGRVVPFTGVTPARKEPPVAGTWPALAATAGLLVAMGPWVAIRAGWCAPERGACASIPASATME